MIKIVYLTVAMAGLLFCPMATLSQEVAGRGPAPSDATPRSTGEPAADRENTAQASGISANRPGLVISSAKQLKLSSFSQSGQQYVEVQAEQEPDIHIRGLGRGFDIKQIENVEGRWIMVIRLFANTSLKIDHGEGVLKIGVDVLSEVSASQPGDRPEAAGPERTGTNAGGSHITGQGRGVPVSFQRAALPLGGSPTAGATARTRVPVSRAAASVVNGNPSSQDTLPNPAADPNVMTTREGNLDLSVPESPAFTILGLTPQDVVRPGTPGELATAFLNGRDANGNFQTGVAIDFAPFLVAAGDDLTINEYRASPFTRFLTRTQMSFATAKASSDEDTAVRFAFGLNATIFDKGDPRMDKELSDCFQRSLRFPAVRPGESVTDYNVRLDAMKSTYDGLADGCREQSRKRNWNRSSWMFGVAPSWISKDGNLDSADWNGGAIWTSLAWGFEGIKLLQDTSQLILHARYRTKEQVPVPDLENVFFEKDSLFLGGRFRIGHPDFAGNLEATFINNKPEGMESDHSYRISVGAEKKLTRNLWLQVSFGGEGGREDGKNKGFVITSFKYSFARAPRLGED